ncbi:MAG: tRNA pseudouridine(38-40) synthase TruA [Actinobacteria bacterium]|nr:tRNA pseudouridine(38-40) synthase TruA [Actinomycetota bacterium]
MRIRVDLAYDGGPFHGFARQPELRTVQGTLEDRLSRVLGQDVDTIGAGRTDRGVHASGQVVHVDVDEGVAAAARALADLPGLRGRLDRMVGEAITIWRVGSVDPAFDARFSATERRYRYRLADAPALHPLRRFNVLHVGEALSVDRMHAASRHLVGEHDFASLCRAAEGRSTVRRVDHIEIARADGLVDVAVRGPAFCQQQVRSIVGMLVEVGRGRRDPDWALDVLAARDRSAAPRVAPAHGLTLEAVSYGRRWPAAPPNDVLDAV